jgi:hypothetical protein
LGRGPVGRELVYGDAMQMQAMKIEMMSHWNTADGASIHAELVGRAWVKAGHQVRVLSALSYPNSRRTPQKDEGFVIRHFSVDQIVPVTRATWFDPDPIIYGDYEVFVAQNVERLPTRQLLDIFSKIKEKSVTVQVVHEGLPPGDPLFYKFDWDAVVCFDERYKEYLVDYFPLELIHIIPFPCYPLRLGDKAAARAKLNLPLDKKIVFSFGFRPKDIMQVFPSLEKLSGELDLRYLIVANPGGEIEILEDAVKGYEFVDVRISALHQDDLYTYLHASDVLLIHKESSSKYKAVLSSMVLQTLGSGCPILVHESNYVERHGDEITKYADFDDMKEKLRILLEAKFDITAVAAFIQVHNSDIVAESFVSLFEELLDARQHSSLAG